MQEILYPREVNVSLLMQRTEDLLAAQQYVILGIDGRCGAGKTTLAGLLSSRYDCNVIHMDDFYLPFSMRTPERMSEPGGNVHFERFEEEVLPLLRAHETGTYRIYSCSTGEYSAGGSIRRTPLTVVEGSYAMHSRLRACYNLTVFADVSPSLQKERLLHRNGAEALSVFEAKWIPMEERYIEYFQIPKICDHIIRLTDNMVR